MEKQFTAAGQGLMKLFFGTCLSGAYVLLDTPGLLLGLMPQRILSAVLCQASYFLAFVGLTASAVADSGYRRAIWCARVSTVAGLLAALLVNRPVLIFALAAVRQCADLAGMAVVCRISGQLLDERGAESRAGYGKLVWWLCALSSVGIVLCGGAVCTVLNSKAMLAAAVTYLVMQIAQRVIYMVNLYRSHSALQNS